MNLKHHKSPSLLFGNGWKTYLVLYQAEFQYYRHAVDSRYYDTAGIKEMYQYIQTIDKTSKEFYCLVMVRIQILYRNKQYSLKQTS